jgi:hypothetical protein
MDLTGWTPVTDAGGKVLGWTAPPDGETPHERAFRIRVAGLRADAIDAAAALFADPAFDLEKTYDVAEAAMPGADVNAASYIGLVLREVELNGGGGGD